MPVPVAFKFPRGDTRVLVIGLTGVDMAGSRAMYVAWREGQALNDIERSILDGGIEWDPDEEELRIPFPAELTDTLLTDTKYLHELEIRDVFGNVSTIFSGLYDGGVSHFLVGAERIRSQE